MGVINKDEIKAGQERFRKRLVTDAKEIPIGEIMPNVYDQDEIWYAKPATGTEADKITAHLRDGNLFAAQCESIYWRVCADETLQKRKFPQALKQEIWKYDPMDVAAIVDSMGGFEDIAPDVEETEKNSHSTHKPEQS